MRVRIRDDGKTISVSITRGEEGLFFSTYETVQAAKEGAQHALLALRSGTEPKTSSAKPKRKAPAKKKADD